MFRVLDHTFLDVVDERAEITGTCRLAVKVKVATIDRVEEPKI